MRGGSSAIEQASFAKHERTGAHRSEPHGSPRRFLHPVEQFLRESAIMDQGITGDEEREYRVANYLDNLPVPVLGLYGTEDDLIAVETVDEAQRRNDHGQWLLYEGAGHSFLDADSDSYDADAVSDAYPRLVEFFKTTLPPAEEIDLG